MADDNILIAKEQLSTREANLKNRLYTDTRKKPYAEDKRSTTEVLYDDFIHDRNKQLGQTNQVHSTHQSNTNIRQGQQAGKASNVNQRQAVSQMHQNATDDKMHSFLDEMRQQFLQTQNVNVIPQSLIYRQTQLMEQQVSMLEKNQKQMGEVINNILNQPRTGAQSSAAIQQTVKNENIALVQQMMAGTNQQLNEMRILYENTRASSGDLEKKIEELKRVLSMQQGALQSGQPMQGYSGSNQQDMFKDNGMLDPFILQKGIAVLQQQMKDVQKEALQIENEMERRFSDMLNRNAQRKYLPRSLTDEVIEQKQQDGKAPTVGFQQIREAITERLGGEFDYAGLCGEFREIQSDLDRLKQQFRRSALVQPEFRDKNQDRIPNFDFTVPSIPCDSPFAQVNFQASANDVKVSKSKPADLDLIETHAEYIIDCDPAELERLARNVQGETKPTTTATVVQPSKYSVSVNPQPQIKTTDYVSAMPPTNQNGIRQETQSIGGMEVRPRAQQQNESKGRAASPKVKEVDMLTLKKQVIEEIKNELQFVGNNKKPQIGNQNYLDPFSRIDSQPSENVYIKGKKTKQEDSDDDVQIMHNQKKAFERFQNDPEKLVRESVQSVTQRQSITESQVLQAVADMVLAELYGQKTSEEQHCEDVLTGSTLSLGAKKRQGEDQFEEIFNKIWDDHLLINQKFEAEQSSRSRQQLSKNGSQPLIEASQSGLSFPPAQVKSNSGSGNNHLQQDQHEAPQPYNQVPQMHQMQPMVIPIVMGNQQQANLPFNSQAFLNEVRESVNQAITDKLSLNQLKQTHNLSNLNMADLRQKSYLDEEEQRVMYEQQLTKQMIPIDARELLSQQDLKYSNPFANIRDKPVPPPYLVNIDESEDSFYLEGHDDPLQRSEGEIGGDLYMSQLKKPEAGRLQPSKNQGGKNSKLGQTQGYLDNVPKDGVNDPVYESNEGPLQKKKGQKSKQQVFQSAESFGGKPKFGQRQQIQENFLDNSDNESGEIDPSIFI